MGETDLRRGARWLGVAALALGLVAATALAAPPQGNFTVTPNTPNQGEPALFTCKPCPGKAEVAWDLDGVPGFEASGRTATATFDSPGPHTVSMLLTEDDETNTITKTVTVNAPPTVTFDWDPDSPLVGQEVDFQSQVSDPEGNTVTRAWEFGDGQTGTGAGPSHTYAAPGTYTVTVTATDSNGASGTATQSIVVRSDAGPTSSYTFAPPVPDVGETVSFTSTSQASQGAITDIDWDFDGNDDFADFTGSPALLGVRHPWHARGEAARDADQRTHSGQPGERARERDSRGGLHLEPGQPSGRRVRRPGLDQHGLRGSARDVQLGPRRRWPLRRWQRAGVPATIRCGGHLRHRPAGDRLGRHG